MTLKPKELYRRFRAWQEEPVRFSDEALEEHRCPNCGHEFKGNYCPVCRQDAGDGRITWKWVYKCVMTVWGMDSRSLPHTLLQLLFRPGHLIGDYLGGRRQVSYTPVNMLFIVALVYVIIKQLFGIEPAKVVDYDGTNFEVLGKALNWMTQNPGWAMMFMTMMLILPTWLTFRFSPRHTRHSLPEGIIIQVYMSTLMLLVSLLTELLHELILLIPFYYVVVYRQLFGYGVWGTIWRLLLCSIVWLNGLLFFISLATFVDVTVWTRRDAEGITAAAFIALVILALAAVILFIGWAISKRLAKKSQNPSI